MAIDDLNPYRSPRSTLDLQVQWDPNAELQSGLVKSQTLYRHVKLWGRLEAELIWNASGPKEYVSVNGRKAAAMHAFFRSIPYFEFELQAPEHMILVTVEVRVAWIYWTKAFRITVDHQIAYTEGNWR